MDREDLRVVAALQCDVRLSAERAGAVLGLNPRHVQRRWSALLEDGSLRLTASPDAGPGALTAVWRWALDPAAPSATGPGSVAAVLAALADRGDLREVEVSASGDEVSATQDAPVIPVTTATAAIPGIAAGALPGMPGLRGVVGARAAVVLHRYLNAASWRLDVLTGAERAQLVPPVGPPATRASAEEDRDLVALLRRDPRASAVTVAAACGWPPSTARRRLSALVRSPQWVPRVHLDARLLGLGARAHVHLRTPPGRVDAVARALAGHDSVHEMLAVTGPTPLRALVHARDVEHLHLLLTRDLPALADDALTGMETVLLTS